MDRKGSSPPSQLNPGARHQLHPASQTQPLPTERHRRQILPDLLAAALTQKQPPESSASIPLSPVTRMFRQAPPSWSSPGGVCSPPEGQNSPKANCEGRKTSLQGQAQSAAGAGGCLEVTHHSCILARFTREIKGNQQAEGKFPT